MSKLLKTDLYILKRSKSFYWCAGLNIFLSVITVLLLWAAVRLLGNVDISDPSLGINIGGAPMLEVIVSQGYCVLLSAIFASIFVASDFVNGTIKNIMSRGVSRIKFYLSKFIVCACVTAFFVISSLIVGALMGTLIWGFDPLGTADAWGIVSLVLSQTFLSICYTSLFVFMAFAIRSGGGTAVNILIVLFGSLIFSFVTYFLKDVNLVYYWLEGALNNTASMSVATDELFKSLGIGLAWGGLAFGGGLLMFLKRDITTKKD